MTKSKTYITNIIVASKNTGKIAEIQQALSSLGVNILRLSDFGDIAEAPETGNTFKENACQKALYYALHTGKLCLADDSGLMVDALNGKPGIYSARYAGENASDHNNNLKLLEDLRGVPPEKRTARFCAVVALADGSEIIATAEGTVEGFILDEPRGQGGFGYDPLFFLAEKYGKTMAELLPKEKSEISHRGRALRELAEKLKSFL